MTPFQGFMIEKVESLKRIRNVSGIDENFESGSSTNTADVILEITFVGQLKCMKDTKNRVTSRNI